MSTLPEESLGNVLVLDDEPWFAAHLATLLSQALPCHAVPSGDPGAAIRSTGPKYDLIVTDLDMPDRDGLAVLAEVKALAPRCEVIMLTRYATLEIAVEAMRLGAMDVLQRDERDRWIDPLVRSSRRVLRNRPSRRAPELHRENLIHFFFDRTAFCRDARPPERGELKLGLALEYAVKLLLDSCPGLETSWQRRRTTTEEHDLICLNQAQHPFWRKQGPIVLVECKDRASRPGAPERSRFEEKIRNRKGQATVGIYVSCSGFARTFREMSSPTPVPGGPLPVVVPIDREGLAKWAAARDRHDWLTERAVAAVC